MEIDSIHFYVLDAIAMRDLAIAKMGLRDLDCSLGSSEHTLVRVVGNDRLKLVISSPLNASSPIAEYLASHPSGVKDVSFAVTDLDALRCKIERLGIKIVATSPTLAERPWLRIAGWGAIEHTIVQASTVVNPIAITDRHSAITGIDHIVLNVAAGELAAATAWYRDLFGFEVRQTFDICTETSGLASNALVSANGKIQFNINEPTSPHSQIQEFLDLNGGAGIQHLALQTDRIFPTVERMQDRGLAFLPIPQTYYPNLYATAAQSLTHDEWQQLERLQILMDRSATDAAAILLQIFTQPIFEAPTFFFEIIERRHRAQGFGRGNFQTLFEAIENYTIAS